MGEELLLGPKEPIRLDGSTGSSTAGSSHNGEIGKSKLKILPLDGDFQKSDYVFCLPRVARPTLVPIGFKVAAKVCTLLSYL